MNELHVVVLVSQVPEFVCKQLRKTVLYFSGAEISVIWMKSPGCSKSKCQ